ncbi:MotA/TolQ/ExbB proton channel family protein [Maribellus sp. YY47]|uniref:MotA/TolQ/ExbB proton channel family protein n=1 Tax=Maribellus sp. YY47 TaxID=2929486 RepID=UPI0020019B3F|nr:MotA/TolQ/ExbB proton channel family protein [Maribellus sp. YY47]MCK3686030.1 MotA/TolQ/ExbB proton channel family protein [Maribellus sp. YY47]
MNIFEIFYVGGPLFMGIISFLALLAFGVFILKVVQVIKRRYNLKGLDLILLAGSVAVAAGILAQIIGIVQALEAIRVAGDISPQLVMQGAIVSFYAPIYGFVVFIFSMIFYFVMKEIIKVNMVGNN